MKDDNDSTRHDPRDEDIARLISAAGARPRLTELESARLRRAATAAWEAEVRRQRSRRRVAVSGVAASLLAVVAVAWWIGAAQQIAEPAPAIADVVLTRGSLAASSTDGTVSHLRAGDRVRVGDRLAAAPAAAAALELTNGVGLRIDGGTVIVMDAADALRLEAGRLYADSGGSHDAGRSVTVRTTEAVIRDIGTRFQVIAANEQTRVLVRDGQVRVRSETAEVEAHPGDAVDVADDGSMARDRVAADHPDWDWIQIVAAAPDIDGRPVIELLRWVAAEAGRTLVFADSGAEAGAARIVLSGSIKGLTPLQALDAMLQATDLRYALTAQGAIVVSRR